MNFRERFLQKLPKSELDDVLNESSEIVDRLIVNSKKEKKIFLPSRLIINGDDSFYMPKPQLMDMFVNTSTYGMYKFLDSRWVKVSQDPENDVPTAGALDIFRDPKVLSDSQLHMNKTTIPSIFQSSPRYNYTATQMIQLPHPNKSYEKIAALWYELLHNQLIQYLSVNTMHVSKEEGERIKKPTSTESF